MEERGDAGAQGAPQTGTTIVAVAFQGGVVLGADTRVTTGAESCPLRISLMLADAFDNLFNHLLQAHISAIGLATKSRRLRTTRSSAAPARRQTRSWCPTTVQIPLFLCARISPGTQHRRTCASGVREAESASPRQCGTLSTSMRWRSARHRTCALWQPWP